VAQRIRSALAALAMSSLACSSQADQASGGSSADGGGAEGARVDAGPPAVRTSSSCGNLPILGDFSGPYGPIPDACKACVEAQCCSQATACAGDAECKAWRQCVAAGNAAPGARIPGCTAPTGSSAQLNSKLNACRSSCDACLDLGCAGKPWPTPSAPSFKIHQIVQNFTSGTPLPGVTEKVCAPTDLGCATPVQTLTTAVDGTVDTSAPSAPGGWGDYLDFSGGGIAPLVFYGHFVDLAAEDTSSSSTAPSLTLGLLDSNTWNLLRSSYNLPTDPGVRSRLNVAVASCGNSFVPGATVTSSNADSAAVFSYVANGIPSMTATQTDTSGYATWENHPSGPTTITVTRAGQKLASVVVNIRAGVVVGIQIPPGL
jgi:hypothetical protein